jgi:hypothetical protein
VASSAVDSGSGVEKADSERASERRGRNKTRGTGYFRESIDQSNIAANTSSKSRDRQGQPLGSGWLARGGRPEAAINNDDERCLRT